MSHVCILYYIIWFITIYLSISMYNYLYAGLYYLLTYGKLACMSETTHSITAISSNYINTNHGNTMLHTNTNTTMLANNYTGSNIPGINTVQPKDNITDGKY